MIVEKRNQRLDHYYYIVENHLLHYQSLTHGLFPLDTSRVHHADGHVRDNLYCAMAVWSVSLAYRHLDNDDGRTYELQQSAVKCMRGMLFFYMLQADKVELFKKNQQAVHSLHCKFNINTAEVSTDHTYPNLQIDVVSFYLLVLTQMIASGLNIIYTMDEVHFIQNLVYYVERTYRTADFGMWERGTRYNNGHRELHASSIGMAIAALEAINGFNLYGSKGTLSSVVYVDPDAHYRNTSILRSLLPRESNTKTTDSALLTIVGFPAFAINDSQLRMETKDKITKKLNGRYGFKRFPRDGYGTVFDKPDRQFYDRAELKNFEGIECEWPIFYLFLAIEAVFHGDVGLCKSILARLEPFYIYTKHGCVLPKYFYVSKEDAENRAKHSVKTDMQPNEESTEQSFLMGQSLLLIANLLSEGLVTPFEIDPIGRHTYGEVKFNHGFLNYRYSSFKTAGSDLVVQVCLISQNRTLQANLATYGIETQTPKEIEPMVICQPHELVRVYEELGKNKKLRLSGRPLRPLGALCTSKIYRICGKTVVTYPLLLDREDFYMSLDMSLLVDDLKTCLSFIRRSWNLGGRPTVCFYLQDHNFRGRAANEMVDFMSSLKTGHVGDVKVKLGRLQMLVSCGCVEHLDYLTTQHCSNINIITDDGDRDFLAPCGFESVYHPVVECDQQLEVVANVDELSTEEVKETYYKTSNLNTQMMLLHSLKLREGGSFPVGDSTVQECIAACYVKACYVHNWSVVRSGAALLGKSVASLAPSITSMLACGKQVGLGAFGQEEYVISEPITPADIKSIIYRECMKCDTREVSLQQELVLHIGAIISTTPQLFSGMLKIRIGWIVQAMKRSLERVKDENNASLEIYSLYPSEIKQLLIAVLSGKGSVRMCDITPRNMLEKRVLEGALNRLPKDFYKNVWSILEKCPNGMRLGSYDLPQQPLLSVSTNSEMDFKLRVEELLAQASWPVERQIIVELLVVLSTILDRNPELEIQTTVNITELVEEAVKLFTKSDASKTRNDFFLLEPAAEHEGSSMFLAHAVVNSILHNSLLHFPQQDGCVIT